MQTNRSLIKLILLSIITLGIYALFFWSAYARDMNIVCEGDGKKTRGILARIVFSILTLGIYDFVWLYGAGDRIAPTASARACRTTPPAARFCAGTSSACCCSASARSSVRISSSPV